MHSFIAAMAKRFHIDLAIIVGHPAMIGSGPLGGYPVETGLVIASTDAVAADVAGHVYWASERKACAISGKRQNSVWDRATPMRCAFPA